MASQLRLIRGPRLGSGDAERAFDDAFVAVTALRIAGAQAVVALLGTTIVTAAPVRPSAQVFMGMAAILSLVFGICWPYLTSSPWARGYFRKFLPVPAAV